LPGMSVERAFWNAALTVGTAYVVSTGLVLYLVHPQKMEWPGLFFIVPAVIALPTLVLFTVVYSRYREGTRPQTSRRQDLIIGSIWALVAAFYILGAFFDHGRGWRHVSTWLMAGGSLSAAIDRFYCAHRKSGNLPGTQ